MSSKRFLRTLLISGLLFVYTTSSAQLHQQDIKNKLLTSDSVFIVSHERYLLDTMPGRSGIRRQLLVKGVLNKDIVKQVCKLDLSSRDTLLAIFSRMKNDSNFEPAFCFDPHQAILFFQKGSYSIVDICFGCQVYKLTNDLTNNENILRSDESFADLKRFFVSKGVTFEINK